MSKKPYVVGIAGGTCSGKSTITARLTAALEGKYRVTMLNMDRYFKRPGMTTIAPITRIEYPEHNHPDALDTEKLYADFEAAINGNECDVVLIEGLFALYLDRIREQLDLKVFIDLKSDERLYRRIKRWLEREDIDKISHRYLDTVRFRHDELIEPTRWHADMVINGTLDANKGTEMLLYWIESRL